MQDFFGSVAREPLMRSSAFDEDDDGGLPDSRQLDGALLEGVEVVAEVARGPRIDQLAPAMTLTSVR